MRPLPLVVAGFALLLLSCGAAPDGTQLQDDWQHVLSRKKAAVAPNASTQQKQLYADTLGAFVQKHPSHSRARAVYQRIQLDFARELAALGRYQDSIRFYRAVLANDPANAEASHGVTVALDHLAVSRQKLLALEKGMSQHQVAQLLGKPVPGWSVRYDQREPAVESWYYRTTDGQVAGVYFRDGVLFGAEANSDAQLSPLTR
jgi:hypothetical protein